LGEAKSGGMSCTAMRLVVRIFCNPSSLKINDSQGTPSSGFLMNMQVAFNNDLTLIRGKAALRISQMLWLQTFQVSLRLPLSTSNFPIFPGHHAKTNIA